MSTYYYIFAEVKVGNKWYNLNPLFMQENGEIDVCPVLCGQSWLRDAYEELEQDRYASGRPSDMTREVNTFFSHDDSEPFIDGFSQGTYKNWYDRSIFLVNYGKSVKKRVKKDRRYRYTGYADKHCIAAFEIGETDCIGHWLTEEEYNKLSETKRKEYAYYEWSEWDDWYNVYNIIVQKIDSMLDYFYEWADCAIKNANLDELRPSADYVRLIVYRD